MYKNRSFKRRGEDKTEIIEVISKVRQISDRNKSFQAFLKTFEIASERKNYTKYLRTKITIPSVNAAKNDNLSNFLIFKRLACVFFGMIRRALSSICARRHSRFFFELTGEEKAIGVPQGICNFFNGGIRIDKEIFCPSDPLGNQIILWCHVPETGKNAGEMIAAQTEMPGDILNGADIMQFVRQIFRRLNGDHIGLAGGIVQTGDRITEFNSHQHGFE